MPQNLVRLRVILSLLAVITSIAYLYTFHDLLNKAFVFEWNSFLSQRETSYLKQSFEQDIRTKFSYIGNVGIPIADFKIPVPLSWHLCETSSLVFFLLSFSLYGPHLNKLLKPPALLSSHLSDFLKKHYPTLNLMLTRIKLIDRPVLFFSAFTFILFASAQLILHHHGAYRIHSVEKLLLALTSAAMFFSFFPVRQQNILVYNRRKFITQMGSVALLSALSPTLIEKFFQSISIKHFSRPRYKTTHTKQWQPISVSTGLYQHKKSKSIYYVNEHGSVRCNSKINELHLDKIHALDLNNSSFPHISKLTASVFFENWSLKLLQKKKLADALQCLEIGCKYEIYRIRELNEQTPNIRIFKLYAGLCYKYKIKHNLSQLRNEVNHDKSLSSLLQPSTQRFLKTRAWWFKRRWFTKTQYNKTALTEI
jgi:hypothetical protein